MNGKYYILIDDKTKGLYNYIGIFFNLEKYAILKGRERYR